MALLSQKASNTVAGTGKIEGGYLSVTKLGDGDSYRFAICSDSAQEYWNLWGENSEGKKAPFRFASEPTEDDIARELGDYTPTLNYDKSGPNVPKFCVAFFVFDHGTEQIKVLELQHKSLIRELDKVTQQEEYADIQNWDVQISRSGLKMETTYSLMVLPRKKGTEEKVQVAWGEAQDAGWDLEALMTGDSPFGGKK
jgi:hypothetical protein